MNKLDLNNYFKSKCAETVHMTRAGGKKFNLKDVNDKTFKGIRVWGHSPMDVTSIGNTNVNNEFNQLRGDLYCLMTEEDKLAKEKLGLAMNPSVFVFVNGKKTILVNLEVNRYRTYHRDMDYDDGYKTSWIVISTTEVKTP